MSMYLWHTPVFDKQVSKLEKENLELKLKAYEDKIEKLEEANAKLNKDMYDLETFVKNMLYKPNN